MKEEESRLNELGKAKEKVGGRIRDRQEGTQDSEDEILIIQKNMSVKIKAGGKGQV